MYTIIVQGNIRVRVESPNLYKCEAKTWLVVEKQ